MFSGKKKSEPAPRRAVSSGNDRNAVFSYYAKQQSREKRASSRQNSERAGQERTLRPSATVKLQSKRRLLLHNLPLLIALAVLSIGIIYNTTLSSDAQIITDSVSAESQLFFREKSAYQTALNEELESSVLNSSKLTIDTDEIRSAMIERFPELADITVTLPLVGRRPVVHLQASQPALVLTSGDQAYILDTRGIVLMDARDFTADVTLLSVVDQSGLAIEKGKAALSSEQVAFIQELQRQFSAKGIVISEVTLPAEPQQVNVAFKDRPYYAKFLFTEDSRVAAGGLVALRSHLDKKNITPKEYVDLRIAGRAYYR
jgi:hypothetical protein